MSTNIQQPAWIADLHTPRWLGPLLVALPIALIVAYLVYQSTQTLPRLSVAPSYALIDQNGETFTSEMVRGSLVLYYIAPAHCNDPCSESNPVLHQLQETLADVETGDIPVQLVTLSAVPEDFHGYANDANADSGRWHLVSGEPQQVNVLLQMGEQAAPRSGNDSFFALVDGWGIVRAVYPTATADVEAITHDLRLVAREARNSTGVNRYAYEAVHLFMCHNDLITQP